VHAALSSVMSSMHSWKKENFKSVPKEIEKMRSQLDELATLTDTEYREKE
jgi:hypothetical protein